MYPEVIALLLPENKTATDGAALYVTALVRDAQGTIELRRMRPDPNLFRTAKLAGRFNCGKPIVDPQTREVIGCELEPLPTPAG